MTDFESYLVNDNVRWRGKPKKSCFILECIFNPFLIFALIWAALDFFILSMMNSFGNEFSEITSSFPGQAAKSDGFFGAFKNFYLIFFLIHLMPVWIYLGGVLLSFLRWRNIEYAITDRGIYFSSGIFSKQVNFKPFAEISSINIHRGIIDQMTGCGDVSVRCGIAAVNTSAALPGTGFSIQDISDYQEVFAMVRQMQTDIYADTMYPNALRPENNPGYRTQYRPTNSNFDDRQP